MGHGDSIILEIQCGSESFWAVIDCHNPRRDQESPTLQFLRSRNINRLECICLSHPDLDHYSGLVQLLEYYSEAGRSVGRFCDCGMDIDKYTSLLNSTRQERELSKLYSFVFKLQDEGRIQWDPVSYGSLLVGANGVIAKSLGPLGSNLTRYIREVGKRLAKYKKFENPGAVDKNLLSVVVLVRSSLSNSLLCSDATTPCLEATLNRWSADQKKEGAPTDFDFIKVSHHGSKSNNHKGLWSDYTVANRSAAAISCGGGGYYLPDRDVVESILNAKVSLYCTNRTGCLTNTNMPVAALQGVSELVREGVALISAPPADDSKIPPLHGTITFADDGVGHSVTTQLQVPPVTSIP